MESLNYDDYIMRKAEEYYFGEEPEEIDENKLYQEYVDQCLVDGIDWRK